MKNQLAIKRFVQQTLGCTCPDEVFEKIDVDASGSEAEWNRLLIGDRLLIYVLKLADNTNLEARLQQAIKQGVEDRNSLGLNRFRLVLVTHQPESLRAQGERIFTASVYHDDKTHLHLVGESEVAPIWT